MTHSPVTHPLADPTKTRRQVIDLLKKQGEASASDMADQLSLTTMAVRQHLYGLEIEGLVEWTAMPASGRGRPTKLWNLTQTAQRLFPDAHQDLAVDLITTFRETLGDDAFDTLLSKRGEKQVARYRQTMGNAKTLKARCEVLTAIRNEEGYMAELEPLGDGEGWLLTENHCPVCAAAKICSGICTNELDVFQASLGTDCIVTRTDHLLAGARRCAYEIRPAS